MKLKIEPVKIKEKGEEGMKYIAVIAAVAGLTFLVWLAFGGFAVAFLDLVFFLLGIDQPGSWHTWGLDHTMLSLVLSYVLLFLIFLIFLVSIFAAIMADRIKKTYH